MIKLIAAYDQNKLIGKNGFLPWNLLDELIFFKNETLNKTILMGDITFNGIGRSLPDRKIIVLTLNKNLSFNHENVSVTHDFNEIIKKYKNNLEEDIYICGGATIYKLFLPYVDEMIISHIKENYEGDSWFPLWEEKNFETYKKIEMKNFTVKKYKRK